MPRMLEIWNTRLQLLYMVMAPLLLAVSSKILERSQAGVGSNRRTIDK